MVEQMCDVEVITECGTGMVATPSWDEFAAAQGTVFHTRRFLLSWWNDRPAANPGSRLVTAQVVDDERIVGICAFELDSGALSFAGGADVVDYMGPVAAAGREKEVAAALARWMFDDALPWDRAHLAGLVHNDAAGQAIVDEVVRIAPAAVVAAYDQAPRIEAAPLGYLPYLNSKRRADILRKRNRLTEAVGDIELVASTAETVLGSVERLLAWKAAASAETRSFVDSYGDFVRTMVGELAAVDACHVVELHAGGRPLASAIMLYQQDTAYIYNMAYDMSLTAPEGQVGLAPGVVLVSLLVERSLERGLRFDFLKGAQDYKLRLGGVPVDLIGVTVDR
ncbi:MAG TPA: GNAT family N-acetyltransferase [Actinospica sp.]|nr:GNAT family N-acetyltransferase [Actinospica sp.]